MPEGVTTACAAATNLALRLQSRPTSGGGGIRTLGGRVTPTTVFETAPFNHSGTPPGRWLKATDRLIRRDLQRRDAKKSDSSAAHSSASRPPATSGRWLSL